MKDVNKSDFLNNIEINNSDIFTLYIYLDLMIINYKRSYKKLSEVLANIGGMSQVIINAVFFILFVLDECFIKNIPQSDRPGDRDVSRDCIIPQDSRHGSHWCRIQV